MPDCILPSAETQAAQALKDLLEAYIQLYRRRFIHSNPYDEKVVKVASRAIAQLDS